MKKLGVLAAALALAASTMAVMAQAAPAGPATSASSASSAATPDLTASGRTVDAATGRRVPFVVVIAYEEDYRTPITSTIADRRGRFVLEGLTDEEFALRYVGAVSGYEDGWQACNKTVVQRPRNACTQGPGWQGRIRLDRRR